MKDNGRNVRMSKKQVQNRKKRQMKKRMILLLFIISYVILAFSVKKLSTQMKQMQTMIRRIENARYETDDKESEEKEDVCYSDYVSTIGEVEVGKPVKRTWTETLQKLYKLGEKYPLIDEINQNSSLYPEGMLTALANTPEMADYVAGYRMQDEGNMEIKSGWTEAEKEQEYPLLLQWDPRWGYQPYGSSNYIGVAGCGPTCLAMVLYYLTGNDIFTPDRIAAYAMANGYYVDGTGTAWALMKDLPLSYNIEVSELKIAEHTLKGALDQGEILICAMREGDFTVAGHFIVIYGYDEQGFMVNDPNCVARSRKRWTYDEIGDQIKCVWGYRKFC